MNNILLISVKSERSKGGIAIWTSSFLEACEKNKIQCDVVNIGMIGKRATQGTAKRNLRDELIRTRNINKQLGTLLKNNDYDVAHLNTSVGLYGIIRDYYIAKKIHKNHIPLILHFHCNIPDCVKNRVVKKVLKRLLNISAESVVLNKFSAEHLEKFYNCKSLIIPNFVDTKIISDKKKIEDKMQNAFFVGRITRDKGAKEIYDTAQRVPEMSFILAGEVDAEVNQWNKPTNVNLIGMINHDDVFKYLDKTDLFIFPSHTEGFSMSLTECMARGVPAIATNVGANMDMLENIGGRIVNINDANAIVEAISKIQSRGIREEMSEWCIEKVKSNYTSDIVIHQLIKLYEQTAKNRVLL